MAKYNLIRNAYLNALTSSGTGNVNLSWQELESLMDGNTISSGVSLTSSDILYLETDLSQRIKIDGIRLYTNDTTKSSNINFYYKDNTEDEYTLLTTQVDSYYYTTIFGLSAPRYVRVTISGVTMDIREFQIFNDDYIVAFGTDGQLYSEYIEDSPVGEEGTPQAIPIYNNGSSSVSADAYVAIDCTSTSGDRYIKISNNINGTYYSLEDGALISDNYENSSYIWDMGNYNGVELENNRYIKLVDVYTIDKLCDIPLMDASESFNVGESTMAYDANNEVIYTLGCEASPTILKFYKYDIATNEFDYLWEVNPGVSNFEKRAGICYLDGYVYIMCNNVSFDFGRYNMTTMSGVWESLTSPSSLLTGVDSTFSFSMDVGNNGYIYFAGLDGIENEFFLRYNTVSGSWGTLNSGFGTSSYSFSYNTNISIACDNDRDYVYSIAGEHINSYPYISRYNIATDTWQTDYLNRSVLGGAKADTCIEYKNNNIVSYNSDTTTDATAYIYNIPTDSIRTINVGNPSIHAHSSSSVYKIFMKVINPVNDVDIFSIIFGSVSGYMDELYSYNMISHGVISGYYISPIFVMNDPDESSYFVIDGTTVSGYTSISYDEDSYNGTIQYRSSNTPPLLSHTVYIHYSVQRFNRWVPYTDVEDINWQYGYANNYNICSIAVDNKTGNIATSCRYESNFASTLRIINSGGDVLYSTSASNTFIFNVKLKFDTYGGLWGYGNAGGDTTAETFRHYNYLLDTELADLGTYGYDFVYDFDVEYDGDGVWYTNKVDNLVEHADSDGNSLQQIALTTPRAICTTLSKGCWVVDDNDFNIYKYDFNGNLITTLNFGTTVLKMEHDLNDGFWYIYNNYVYHVRGSDYVRDVSINLSGAEKLVSTIDGCWVYSSVSKWFKFIEYSNKSVKYSYDDIFIFSSSIFNAVPGVFSSNIENGNSNHLVLNEQLPTPYDPVWGPGGSLEWQEVRKDGYFLPKRKYHQVKITLRSNILDETPYLNKIVMAPALKVTDIPRDSYKNVYIKSDIPDGADDISYSTRLKAWWGID